MISFHENGITFGQRGLDCGELFIACIRCQRIVGEEINILLAEAAAASKLVENFQINYWKFHLKKEEARTLLPNEKGEKWGEIYAVKAFLVQPKKKWKIAEQREKLMLIFLNTQ